MDRKPVDWYRQSVWRKAPPRLKEFNYRGECAYFVTCATQDRRRIFTVDHVVTAAREALEQACGERDFRLWAWCFMPDHVHALVQGVTPTADFRAWIKLFKQRSGYAVRRADLKVGPYGDEKRHDGEQVVVWQRGYYEHVLRKDEALHDVAWYILENPVRAGLITEYWQYPYSWAEGLKTATAGRPEGRPLREAATATT